MPSSTSSSEHLQASRPPRAPSRRLAQRATLAAVAVALLAVLGARAFFGAARERRSADDSSSEVALPQASFDLVLVGDSHVRQGVVPSVLSAALDGARVHSAAIAGMPLSPEYLHAAARALDPRSDRRILAVGVSLATQKAPLRTRRDEFAPRWRPGTWTAALEQRAARELPSLLQPYVPQHRAASIRISTLHDDGWRERDAVVRRDPREGLDEERWNLLAQPFDRTMVEANRRALLEIAHAGVQVVVFALPSDVGGVEPLVEAWAGVTAAEYAQRVCPPGGVVVDLAFGAGDTYDGHHLHPDAARRVSAQLAQALAATPPSRPASPRPAGVPPR